VDRTDTGSAATGGCYTCPSAPCEAGATLLGVISADGRVGFVQPPVQISLEFVERAHRGNPPERRFRFAQPCVEHACAQWVSSRCSIIDRVQSAYRAAAVQESNETDTTPLPTCSIRKTCRWFAQSGRSACAVCPLVITDLRSA